MSPQHLGRTSPVPPALLAPPVPVPGSVCRVSRKKPAVVVFPASHPRLGRQGNCLMLIPLFNPAAT